LRKEILILTFTLILVLVSSSGCIENNGNNSTTTFQNSEISFDYPSNWVTFSDFWPSTFGFQYNYSEDDDLNATEIAGVLNPDSKTAMEKYSVSVKIETINSTRDLKEIFNSTYSALSNKYNSANATIFQEISEGNLTVDGVTAYEKVYKLPHGEPYYQIRDIWLKKNNTIYIISCRTFPSNYNESQNDFNIIINSFHVK
jgi:hypothetical protein